MSETKEYIKKLTILGYKKFRNFHINFKPGLNILIGENGVGKSTILEAINIVLNQTTIYQNTGEYQQLFNIENIHEFKEKAKNETVSIADLPKIEIKLEFCFSEENPQNFKFFKKEQDKDSFGILFKYEFDENYTDIFNNINFKENQTLPLEYYHAVWTTLSGNRYIRTMNPLKSILIDTSSYMRDIYGNYAKSMYQNVLDENSQRKVSFGFNQQIKNSLNEYPELIIDDNRKFSVDENKSNLINLLDIKENDISLKNIGKGEENILKTEISLNKNPNHNPLKLVMIEEPENHLSYSNTRQQINTILSEKNNVKQLIITTHESMILNRLNLSNAIWIKENEGNSLSSLPEGDIQFFKKIDNFDILKYILGHNIILVEGASEFIILPEIIKKIFKKNMDELKIDIISMQGIRYKHFIELSKIINKKTLVLTDNDGSQDAIDKINEINSSNNQIYIATPQDTKQFTLESSLFEYNTSLFKDIINDITEKDVTATEYKGRSLNKYLVAALNRKTEFALKLCDYIAEDNFNVPNYIISGLNWLKNNGE